MIWSYKLAAQAEILQDMPIDRPAVEHYLIEQALAWVKGADFPHWSKSLDWYQHPELIHPLNKKGKDEENKKGKDEEEDKKEYHRYSLPQQSSKKYRQLLQKAAPRFRLGDHRLTSLALWRFAADLPRLLNNKELQSAWSLYPADARFPDQSLWERMDLVSGFAGALSQDQNIALLTMSIGPVQPFIAAARTTSDLWAGSHLLSYLTWQLIRPLAAALGPDAVLFPRLRGIPLVDLWLVKQGLSPDWFEHEDWPKRQSDANPLFAAALPNRFVAVVPLSQAKGLAEQCEQAVRQALRDIGQQTLQKLLQAIGEAPKKQYCFEQMERQLQGFPEVYWAITPLNLVGEDLDTRALREVMQPFFSPDQPMQEKDLLKRRDGLNWSLFKASQNWGKIEYRPHASVLYPDFFELNERLLAASKSLRPFAQSEEKGWRCSLSGEGEYLALSAKEVQGRYSDREHSLWAKVHRNKPQWAKEGEYLSALPSIKRLWPTLFSEMVGRQVFKKAIPRFTVTTTTLSLVKPLARALKQGKATELSHLEQQIAEKADKVALPPRLHSELKQEYRLDLSRLPDALEKRLPDDLEKNKNIEDKFKETLEISQLETYYGILLLDGDRMGKILSGDPDYAISYQDSVHSRLKADFSKQAPDYTRYPRITSIGRHQFISGTLNDFALHIVPHIIEKEYYGRLIYAGGDDVFALLPSSDLLPAANSIHKVYSGLEYQGQKGLSSKNGFIQLNGRLFRSMGRRATVSAGLVIAHHTMPLSQVMNALRSAEKGAKNSGRNAVQIRVLKRSGGHLQLNLAWQYVDLFQHLVRFLSEPAVSRQAVYHSLLWLKDLPQNTDVKMLSRLLFYQFNRQIQSDSRDYLSRYYGLDHLCQQLAQQKWRLSSKDNNGVPLSDLIHFLSIAEFLSRDTRLGEQA